MAAEQVPAHLTTEDSVGAPRTENGIMEANGSIHSLDGVSRSTVDADDCASCDDERPNSSLGKPSVSGVRTRWPWRRILWKRKGKGKFRPPQVYFSNMSVAW